MADSKISDLTEVKMIADEDSLVIVNSNTTKKITRANLAGQVGLGWVDISDAGFLIPNTIDSGETHAEEFDITVNQLSQMTDWVAATAYALTVVVTPSTANGFLMRCVVAGTSHATTEPTWPTSLGDTVVDNGATWMAVLPNWLITAGAGHSLTNVMANYSTALIAYDGTGGTVATPTRYGLLLDSQGIEADFENLYYPMIGGGISFDSTAISLIRLTTAQAKLFSLNLHVAGTYGDGVADLLSADEKRYVSLPRGNFAVLGFAVRHVTDDTGADQPFVTLKLEGNIYGRAWNDQGVQVGTAWKWQDPSCIGVGSNFRQLISNIGNLPIDVEVRCTVAGSNGDAANLSVHVLLIRLDDLYSPTDK